MRSFFYLFVLPLFFLLGGCLSTLQSINENLQSFNDSLSGPTITADESTVLSICQDYENNEIAAEKKWKGKNLVFSGIIYKIEKGLVMTNVFEKEKQQADVWVNLNQNNTLDAELDYDKVFNLKKGAKVSVKGEFYSASKETSHCYLSIKKASVVN